MSEPANRTENRQAATQFKPGKSGNPSGRPKVPPEVKELARAYTDEAIQTLADVMRKGKSDAARVNAATSLLDRAWGKAPQTVTDEDGKAITEIVRRIITPADRG